MLNNAPVADEFAYWQSVLETSSGGPGDYVFSQKTSPIARRAIQKLKHLPPVLALYEGAPKAPARMKNRAAFVNAGLQIADTAPPVYAVVIWCLLAEILRTFSDSVRLFSQMDSHPLRNYDVPYAASLLLDRVIAKLLGKFGEPVLRTSLIVAAELCQGMKSLEEKKFTERYVRPVFGAINPDTVGAKFTGSVFATLSDLLSDEGRFKEAESLAKIGLVFFPHVPELLVHKTERGIGEGLFERVPSELERIIELFPDLPEFRRRRAFFYFDREEYAKAAEDMRAYLELVPNDRDVRTNYAQSLAMSYHPIEAIEQFTQLVDGDPSGAAYYLGRARVYDQLEMISRAIEDYARALELDPALVEAQVGREQSIMKRRSMGMDDDVYTSYVTGMEDRLVAEKQVPSDKFADIAGLDSVKEIIRETIQYPLIHPELAAKYGKKAGGGVLFFGPPGCGKTMLARAAAGECGIPFINVNLSSVLDKWVGNSEKAISIIFRTARKSTPCMIFFDELDALGMAREDSHTGWEKKIISQLLIEMDGIESNNLNLMILGATNSPWNVDLALRRAGRFGKTAFVPPPNVAERRAVLKLYIERRPIVDMSGIDYDALAAKTEYHSSDNLRQIVEDAAAIPWKEAILTGNERPIEMRDLLIAVEARQPDLMEWDKLVRKYEEFSRQTKMQTVIGFRGLRARKQTL